MVIRTCALDSGTLTLDTELVRMSHCGSFVLDGRSASPRQTNTIKSSISFFSSSGRQFFSRENETPPRAHQSSSSPAEISSSVFCLLPWLASKVRLVAASADRKRNSHPTEGKTRMNSSCRPAVQQSAVRGQWDEMGDCMNYLSSWNWTESNAVYQYLVSVSRYSSVVASLLFSLFLFSFFPTRNFVPWIDDLTSCADDGGSPVV